MANKISNKRKFSKKRRLLLAITVFFVAFLTLALLEMTNVINIYSKPDSQNEQPNSTNTINYSPATEEDDDISNQVKQNSPSPQASAQNLQVTLSQVTQDPSSRALIVRSLIEGASAGSCKLELVRNNAILVTKQANISQQNNYATCEGFDIPASELPTLGEITVNLSVTANGTTQLSSQNIILEK